MSVFPTNCTTIKLCYADSRTGHVTKGQYNPIGVTEWSFFHCLGQTGTQRGELNGGYECVQAAFGNMTHGED